MTDVTPVPQAKWPGRVMIGLAASLAAVIIAAVIGSHQAGEQAAASAARQASAKAYIDAVNGYRAAPSGPSADYQHRRDQQKMEAFGRCLNNYKRSGSTSMEEGLRCGQLLD